MGSDQGGYSANQGPEISRDLLGSTHLSVSAAGGVPGAVAGVPAAEAYAAVLAAQRRAADGAGRVQGVPDVRLPHLRQEDQPPPRARHGRHPPQVPMACTLSVSIRSALVISCTAAIVLCPFHTKSVLRQLAEGEHWTTIEMTCQAADTFDKAWRCSTTSLAQSACDCVGVSAQGNWCI